jgi:DNA ligase (NAD+)
MDKKKKIINQHKKKIDILEKHNTFYFTNDNPKISDSEYDKLKRELTNLEENYPYLKQKKSVKDIIGSKPSNKFKKIDHLVPMLSLSNAFQKKDMNDFLKKINNFLNYKENSIELFSEPKIDGI